MSSLPILARRTALVTVQRPTLLCHVSLKAFGSQASRIAQVSLSTLRGVRDNRDGNGYEDYSQTEHLEDMPKTTCKIEDSVDELKATYAQKRRALKVDAGTNSPRMSALFDKAAAQNEQISNQIASLKAKMVDARKVFAVDAPDGTPDYELKRGLKEVDQIIDFAAEHEDLDEVIHEHQAERKERARARKIFAVESPDGTPDYELKRGLKEVDQIIAFAGEHEDLDEILREHQTERKERARARKIFAVESSDGTPDYELKRGLKEVDQIIAFAGEHEDLDEVLREHQAEKEERARARKTFAVESPDGTPDYELKRGLKEVDQIIDFAAEHEDAAMVKKQHEIEEAGREAARKAFAVDAPGGTPNYLFKEVDQIIDYAASHEDVDMVNRQHEMEDAERNIDRRI
jgi:succinate dehydrogenase flavin-adding protein (antitoxin of CptAB toxin-antitoxin module)